MPYSKKNSSMSKQEKAQAARGGTQPRKIRASLKQVKPSSSKGTPVDRSGAKPGRPKAVGAQASVTRGSVHNEQYTIIKAMPKRGTKKITFGQGTPGFTAAKKAWESEYGKGWMTQVQKAAKKQKKTWQPKGY
jgi:hypothetical protein